MTSVIVQASGYWCNNSAATLKYDKVSILLRQADKRRTGLFILKRGGAAAHKKQHKDKRFWESIFTNGCVHPWKNAQQKHKIWLSNLF